MGRRPRFVLPGVPQHIIQRGNNREPCFFSTEDYQTYLSLLAEVSIKYGCQIHAYVLMTNHVHLLLSPNESDSISKMMQSLGRRYVHYINHTYARTGTLWEGRYKASLIQSEQYLLTCYRYIELNPIRANMVAVPGDYLWSSYHANAFGKKDTNVIAHDEYLKLGETCIERYEAYRELFRYHIDDGMVHVIRDAINQELVVGSDRFKDKIEKTLQRSTRRKQAGRPCVKETNGQYDAY
jgi:putative transposase